MYPKEQIVFEKISIDNTSIINYEIRDNNIQVNFDSLKDFGEIEFIYLDKDYNKFSKKYNYLKQKDTGLTYDFCL